jgi:hypothetical protein
MPGDLEEAAEYVALFSAAGGEWSGEPHDVTEDPPPGLRPWETVPEMMAEMWESVLSKLDGEERSWLLAVKNAVDGLARALDTRRQLFSAPTQRRRGAGTVIIRVLSVSTTEP